MTSVKIGPNSSKPASKLKPPRAKATAEERAALRAEKKRLAQEQEERENAAFEQVRELTWLRTWTDALRLHLLSFQLGDPELSEPSSGIRVDPMAQTISANWLGTHSQKSLSRATAEELADAVSGALQDVLDAIEARRQAEAERQRLAKIRAETIAVLSADQRKALNLL